MTTGYGFNWTWVENRTDTKRDSSVVYKGGGTIFSFRQPENGAISSSDLNAFVRSTSQNLQQLRSNWRTYTYPILNSLPAGGTDNRWSTELGKGLPDKIDCFAYGLQGSTLFVFNDANDTKADGRYWRTDEFRPKTIAEAFEDVYSVISNIESGISSSSDSDLDPLWASIGEEYRDASFRSATGSIYSKVSILDTYIQQINTDLYDPSNFPYSIGTPLPYSVAEMVDNLLKLHGISGGWGSDPSTAAHSALPYAAHTHDFDEIVSPPAASSTQGRVGPFTSLNNEILRLRYEIEQTRGSTNWYSDVIDPVTGTTAANLANHIGYSGTASVTSSNPHGISLTDIGAYPILNSIVSFTGMTNTSDSTPAYASTEYITQGSNLETAIGELDASLKIVVDSIAVIRRDYIYDRSSSSETVRANTPININHNIGKQPIVEVLDISPTIEDYWGQYSSPALDLNVVHVDENTLEIWTEAEKIKVIMIG